MKDQNIIATAPDDVPEVLNGDDLDAISAAAYGGSNSCEPYAGDNSCEEPSSGRGIWRYFNDEIYDPFRKQDRVRTLTFHR